jgi:hypothetical protein
VNRVRLSHAVAASAVILGSLGAGPAFAATTLVCDLDDSALVVQDSATVLTLDESAQTVSGNFGAWHYKDPSFSGGLPEESLPAIPATFSDQDIEFAAPAGLKHAGAGDKFRLSRITGELQHFSAAGYRVGDVQRCRSATKQF